MDDRSRDGGELPSLRGSRDMSMSSLPALFEWFDIPDPEPRPDIKVPPRLDTLPAEITKMILSYLRENTDPIYDEEAATTEDIFEWAFLVNGSTLRSAALVNRSLSPCAQDLLVECPVLASKRWGWPVQTTSLALFARTLLERPDLGAKVRQLTVMIPNRSLAEELASHDLKEGNPTLEILKEAANHINTLALPKSLRVSWTRKLKTQYPYTLMGVILTLVSNVKQVTLALDTSVVRDAGIDYLCACFGIRSTKAHHLVHFQSIGILSSVNTLTLRGMSPVAVSGLELFPIQNLHLRLEFRPNRQAGLIPATIPQNHFQNVSTLRLDIQLVLRSGRSNRTDPVGYFGPLLSAFRNLKHLDLSDGPRDGDRDYYFASAGRILDHFQDLSRLVSLQLPRKVSSPQLSSTTVSRLTGLKRLTTPFRGIVNEDWDTFESLPRNLQQLVIKDSTFETIPCVLDLLEEKEGGESWVALSEIEIWFAKTFTDKSLERLRQGAMFPTISMRAEAMDVQLTMDKAFHE